MNYRLAWLSLLIAASGCKVEVKPPPAPPPAAVAEFDPLGSPPRIPLPNNLAFTGSTDGKLNIVDRDTDSPAQKDFNAYLRGLEGFPPQSTATATFTLPLDPATATVGTGTTPGAVFVYDVDVKQPFGAADFSVRVSADGKTLEVIPTRRWRSGGTFSVILFGGDDPAGLKGAMGEKVLAAPAFFFLRSPNPVLGLCK